MRWRSLSTRTTIKGLTLQQLDAIFSKTRKGGLAKEIKTGAIWGLRVMGG